MLKFRSVFLSCNEKLGLLSLQQKRMRNNANVLVKMRQENDVQRVRGSTGSGSKKMLYKLYTATIGSMFSVTITLPYQGPRIRLCVMFIFIP